MKFKRKKNANWCTYKLFKYRRLKNTVEDKCSNFILLGHIKDNNVFWKIQRHIDELQEANLNKPLWCFLTSNAIFYINEQ